MDCFSIIPAIDVLEGRCVRLSEGRRERVTVEGGEPATAAARFVAGGARYIHLVALDARDGRVVADGWVSESPLSPSGLARRCAEAGVERLLVTSTRRDGSLAGPDLHLLAEVIDGSGLPVLAAGGIGSLADLGRL